MPHGSVVAMGMVRAQQAGAARAGAGLHNAAAIQISRPLTEAQRRTVLRMSDGALILYVAVSAGSRCRFSGVAELGRGQLADQFAVGAVLQQAMRSRRESPPTPARRWTAAPWASDTRSEYLPAPP